MSARTVTWTITNATKNDWQLIDSSLDSGVWSSVPPQTLHSGRMMKAKAESNGFATGAIGTITYGMGADSCAFRFANPYLGPDNYSVQIPDTSQQTTKDDPGNDYTLNTRVWSAESKSKR